ncbi:MAG: hypothetical protein JWL81_599 [Verrucomicrobiales bacterium]|nr:hypothetical protein [Verrucomicrobiales bacterium]
MKKPVSLVAASTLLLLQITPLHAGTLLFSDNFNAPDNASLDASTQTDRRLGLLGTAVQVRSSRIQHGIVANKLNFLKPATGSGRLRLQQSASLPTNVWTDFAAGTTGTTILAEGGVRVEFDYTSADDTSDNWISVSAGINSIATAEPLTRVNEAGTDFGILFRNTGLTQFFDNGAATVGSAFPAVLTPRHVIVDYAFNSFANGTTVTVKATVNGTDVLPAGKTFTWDNNGGILHFEIGNYAAGTVLDNLSISGLYGFTQSLDNNKLLSSVAADAIIGNFNALFNEVSEPATFTLVAGAGDTDNAKFRIDGGRLESLGFDFNTLPAGTNVSIRVRGTGNNSGASNDRVYALTLITDSDSDDIPDSYEQAKVNNLTDLDGRSFGPGPGAGTGDFDGDTLYDIVEYQFSDTYPNLNPAAADTDADGLPDSAELIPSGTRQSTNPTLADTDSDGLNDLIENNSGTFSGLANPGSSPLSYDTDADRFPDAYEATRNSSPVDALAVPTLPAPLTIGQLTTDESTGIDTSKSYTHAISGGFSTVINGVIFDALKPTSTPPNFIWTANRTPLVAATFNEIAATNLNTWVPSSGNVTGTGLLELFGGFSYSGNGDVIGSNQKYTLTGLVPGQKYEARLYVRPWSNAGTGRPLSLTFQNGTQAVNAYVLEDLPGIMLGNGNADSAYALAFPYTAQSTELSIDALIPATTFNPSGSWHLYGLTNEAFFATPFEITGITRTLTPAPAVTLTFSSTEGAVYAVDSSTALLPSGQPGGWTELTGNLPSEGASTTYQDTTATGPRTFYRIRRLP